jgi:hypothetical protein
MGEKTKPIISRIITDIFSLYEEQFIGYLDIEAKTNKSINGQNSNICIVPCF